MIRLHHFSETPDIARFVPRIAPSASANLDGEAVWAVDTPHSVNYLLPRDCPRVTFARSPNTTDADTDRFLVGTTARRVIAIEAAWLERIHQTTLYRYDFAPDMFTLQDKSAGYYISRESVTPVGVVEIGDLLSELAGQDVEIRILPTLWKLNDAVVASTLEFSMIRMRNAQPRP